MLSLKNKDILIRQKVAKTEYKKLVTKFLFIHLLNKEGITTEAKKRILVILLKRMQNYASKTKIVRRCVITNRGKVSNRDFNISRIQLRNLLNSGILPGYKKAIW